MCLASKAATCAISASATMVAFQIVSDLHLESPKAYDVFDIPPRAPYLALLGDIGYTKHGEDYLGFIRRQLSAFKMVFLVLGNHEPWHSSWADSKSMFRRLEEQITDERKSDRSLGRFVFLDRSSYTLADESSGEEVVILGCTLFSQIPAESAEAVSFGINDFYNISNWTTENHNEAFHTDLSWLNDQVESAHTTHKKVAIFTHYSPTLDHRAMDTRHQNSPLLSGFATDLLTKTCWKSSVVKLWAFGHNHFNCDFVDEDTGIRLFTNQRGYYFSQSVGFEVDKIITI